MPFYRYECEKCGHKFRILHLSGADDVVACPSCESEDAHRLLHRVAVQFKGSGYYKTDRANKKSKAGTKDLSDKDSSTDTDAGAKEKKESKEPKEAEESKDTRGSTSDKPSRATESNKT